MSAGDGGGISFADGEAADLSDDRAFAEVVVMNALWTAVEQKKTGAAALAVVCEWLRELHPGYSMKKARRIVTGFLDEDGPHPRECGRMLGLTRAQVDGLGVTTVWAVDDTVETVKARLKRGRCLGSGPRH